jgi:hypothetical protein
MTITMDDSDRLSNDKFDAMNDFEVSVGHFSDNRDEENERSRMLLREEFQLNDTIPKKYKLVYS